MIPKITVIYIEENGYQEEYNGYLTDSQHAMYVEPKYGELYLTHVMPTNQSNVYKIDSGFLILGSVEEGQEETVINSLMEVLRSRSAYDFLTSVMLNVEEVIEFDDLIIPGLLKAN
ncbi:hypothetical protein O9H85_15425 [Paenibacillus filicis]|uniref:Uncharacterized protein n=1 Tax=Paenibacillus gyeongsangnamensis TaxID=3388067 RepID=A0ABT4QA78_9BACL|nr:hypothetical protein [Paenibacillus filicis]MCZ8513799.1 hypothetical protein [Paenibacillus filicis]